MFSKDFLPAAPLTEYIKVIRLRHFVLKDGVSVSCKPFPPRPEQCLIFYPRGFEIIEDTVTKNRSVRVGSVLSGQYTRRVDRYLGSAEFLMIEVDLQPGALHRLTGIPFREMVNLDIDAEAVFSTDIRRVNERLRSSDSYPEMIGIIEHFFFGLIDHARKEMSHVDRALHLMCTSGADQSLDAVAKMSYLSPRQLERKFIESIGVGPKTFSRICRFNRSYWLRFADQGVDWYSIAISCGYTDYQHMVKDYKEFADATPSQFFKADSKAPGMVLGLTNYKVPVKNVGFLPV